MPRGTLERHRAAPAPGARALSPGARGYALELDRRTAWDFIISAGVGSGTGTEADLLPEDRTWLQDARDSLTVEQRTSLDWAFSFSDSSAFHGLAAVLVERPSAMTAADVLDVLRTVAPGELAAGLLRDMVGAEASPELLAAAIEGDPDARSRLEPMLCDEDDVALREFLAAPVAGIERTAAALAAWLLPFQQIEPRLDRIGAADAALRAADIRSLPTDAAVERVTGGLRYIADARIRRVILAPSYFARPFNMVFQGADWRLFCYPMADEVLESDASVPAPSMVRLFRALGDPTRLQVLRLLTEREWYLTELATHIGLSKPTMKHHLALLRAAGLVTVTEAGGLTYYSLRRERLEEGGGELRRYLA